MHCSCYSMRRDRNRGGHSIGRICGATEHGYCRRHSDNRLLPNEYIYDECD